MKKIYIIESILQTEINYVHLLKKFNETSLDIFEIFTFDYQPAIQVFIGDMFDDVYNENVDTYENKDASVISKHIFQFDSTLLDEVTLDEMIEVLVSFLRLKIPL